MICVPPSRKLTLHVLELGRLEQVEALGLIVAGFSETLSVSQ